MRIHGRFVVVLLLLLGVAATDAQATFRIENHLDPAGDPTRIKYRVEGPNWTSSPFEFELVDGDYLSTGPPPGTYTATALLPPGWFVQDIQCIGPRGQSDFVIEVPNGRVTVTHGATDEHLCAFTNRKLAPGETPSPSPGVSPTPKREAEAPKVVLSRRPALVGVSTGRGFAQAVVRLTRRSVIKGSLHGRGPRVLGAARIVSKPGTVSFRTHLESKHLRRMQRRGMERVSLTLRVAVTARRSGATHVFKHRVLVKL
jgi:hypothetical protein